MSEVEAPDLVRPVEELVAELRALRAERETARRAGDLESIRVVQARVILDEIDQFTGLLDAHGILLEANEAALDGARLRREDVIGRFFWEARWWRADPEGVDWLKGAVGRAFSGEVVRREVDVPTSTGAGVVTVDFTIQPVRDPRGRVEFLLAKGRNVTEKVRAEAAPHQDHAILRAVIAGIDDAIFAKDRSGRYLLVNSAGARRVGRAVEDILGRDDTELFDPETARRIRDDDLRIMREAITLTREETGQAAGVTRVYLATKWPNRDAQGRIIGVLGISRDVTERLQAEEALRQGEANYRLLADNATDLISRHDADGRFLYASPACRTLLGYELRELIGRLSHEFIHRDDLPRVAQARAAMRGEDSRPRTFEYRIRRKDGGYTWVETASRLVHGEAAVSEPEELWVSRDVTERKRAEEALRRSESILRSFYDSAPMQMGVVEVLDDDIRFVSANATVVEHLRPATGDPRGRCARDLGVPEDHIAAWIRHLRESERTGLPIRFEMRAGPVGEGLWFSNTVRFITRDADGTPRFSFISEDITERKRTEEALIEWKGRYEAAIQARGEILYDYDITTGEMTYGGTFEEVLGYSAEDLVDGLARWVELIHPEDRAAFDKECQHSLDTRGPFSLEYRVRCRDGSSIVVQDDGRLFTDATGAPTRVIGFIADITERKRAEDGLRRRNRELAALNAIAAAIGNSLRLPDVLATLERSLAKYLDIRGGTLYLYAGAGTPIARYAGWGVPDPVQAHVEVLLRAGGPRTPAALTAGEPEPSSREGGGPFLTLTLDDAPPPWRYGLCLPLASEVGSQGVLTLFTADPPANDDDHVAFFELLGRQVGAALRNARLYEQVRRGRRRLAALSRRLIMADEDERRHIARELHDEIGQSLTALKLNLQAGAAADDLTAREALAGEGRQIIDRLIMQVRELSLDLRPSLLDDLGLVAALRSYVNRLSQRAGLAARFDASGPEGRLEPDLETACFRVAQEALTNVVRHAHALHVEVGLRQDPGALELFVRDDGIGFDPVEARARAAARVSLGLLGMQERVALVGGRFVLRSVPGRGTEVRARFPLSGPPARQIGGAR